MDKSILDMKKKIEEWRDKIDGWGELSAKDKIKIMASENEPVNIKKNMMERRKRNNEKWAVHINLLADTCFQNALDAGWHTDLGTGELIERNKAEMLMLIVSEVAEAMEGVRKDLKDDHLPERSMEEVELADTIIRIMDYAGRWGLDIGGAIIEKLEYNKNRADHKIENRKLNGGKKF